MERNDYRILKRIKNEELRRRKEKGGKKMAKVEVIMTRHEKEIFQTIKELGIASPDDISRRLGISQGCAEVLCRDMVCRDILIKKGYCYEIA